MKSAFSLRSIAFSLALFLAADGISNAAPTPSLLPAEPLETNGGRVKSERVKGHAAYIRVVSAFPLGTGPFRFKIHPSRGEEQVMSLQESFSMLYQGIEAGPCTFTLLGKDGDTPLAKVKADLGINSYSSVWLSSKVGRVNVMFLDDNYDRTKGTYRVIVRNHFPGATLSLQAITADSPNPPKNEDILPFLSHPKLASGEMHGFDNLPGNDFDLMITAKLPDGKARTTVRRMSFSNGRRFSVVAAQDSYGDFDISLLYDGPTLDAEKSIEAPLVSDTEQPTDNPVR